jgi:molecular chaperone HscB
MTNNFFEIFGLPQKFAVDGAKLAERYRDMQREFHPDRYAHKPEAERNLAVRWASTINQAFDTLKSPLKRAQYLLAEQGLDSTGDSNITNDVSFLMQQMMLREGLSEVRDESDPFSKLEELRGEASTEYQNLQEEFSVLFSDQQYQEALNSVAKMQFFAKLLNEMDLLEEELDD